ncbi:MAG: hypothetical protein Kilf2KO_09320 [Rhodospirillales bacterium]
MKGPPAASGIVLYLLILSGTALAFALWPNLDYAASEMAREVAGGSFAPNDGTWWVLYAGMKPAFFVFMGAVVVLGLVARILRRPVLGITPRRALFIVVALALIQGLVIDLYLKGAFGRARPREIEAFGGALTYTPFYLVSDACRSNCSFVSGHAGMAFATFVLCFLPRARSRRLLLFCAALLFGLLTGWMRVIQGAHFLSDVLFSGLVVFGLTWLAALVFLRPWPRLWDRLLPDVDHAVAPVKSA